MKHINIAQDSPEWMDWRNQGVTASEIAVIFGISPFKTCWQLWAEKSGLRQPDNLDRNPYVRRGKNYEHVLREYVASSRGLSIMPCCIEHDQVSIIRASLDGLDQYSRPWEFKIPSEKKFEDVRQNRHQSVSAKTYFLQVQYQLLCTGAKEGYLVFGRVKEDDVSASIADVIILPIKADPDIHLRMMEQAAHFHNLVVKGIQPDQDPERDVFAPETKQDADKWTKSAADILPLLQRKAEIEAEKKAIEAQLQELSAPVKTILGKNKAGEFAGLRVLRSDRKGSVDWSAYVKSKGDDPDDEKLFDAFRKASSSSYQLKAL